MAMQNTTNVKLLGLQSPSREPGHGLCYMHL